MSRTWSPPGWSPLGWSPLSWRPELAPLPLDLAAAVAARLDAVLVTSQGVATWAGVGPAPPEFETLPYLELSEPDESSEQVDTAGGFVATGQLQLCAYANNRSGARTLADAAEAAIGADPIRFAAGNLMVLRRSARSLELDPSPAPGGGDCWMERRLFNFKYSY